MALFEAMKQDLFPEEPDKITKLLKTIREARFASGMACVHCWYGLCSLRKYIGKAKRQVSFKTTLSMQ